MKIKGKKYHGSFRDGLELLEFPIKWIITGFPNIMPMSYMAVGLLVITLCWKLVYFNRFSEREFSHKNWYLLVPKGK